jgi:CubicO group peptidase (beta-lactamase class C family)
MLTHHCCRFAVLLGLLVPCATQAQQAASPDVDHIFAEFARDDSPGCALGVVRDGQLVLTRGYGSAHLDHSIPNGPDAVYYSGSVSKQFTAAAVALLAVEGRLGLDDDVRRYIPELPAYGAPITIRHLVHHTSGIRDIYTLMSLAGLRMEDVMTDEDALALITRQRELNFTPGDDYLYSNSGYWLLGQVVERVTGQTLSAFAAEHIFRPLGMTRTHFHDDARAIVPGRAMSYGGDARSGFRVAYLGNFDKVGAGGLYTTLGDLARWDANFYNPVIGGRAFLDLMHTRGVLNSGDTIPYAFGIEVRERGGRRIVRHSGSLMGFRADLVRYPDDRFSVLTLCNLGSIDAGAYADRVAELYLGGGARAVAASRPQAPAAADQASQAARPPSADAAQALAARPEQQAAAGASAALVGRYYSEELATTYTVSMNGDSVMLTRRLAGTQPLRHLGGERYSAGAHTLTFIRNSDGGVTGFTVEAGRVRNIRFSRLP